MVYFAKWLLVKILGEKEVNPELLGDVIGWLITLPPPNMAAGRLLSSWRDPLSGAMSVGIRVIGLESLGKRGGRANLGPSPEFGARARFASRCRACLS